MVSQCSPSAAGPSIPKRFSKNGSSVKFISKVATPVTKFAIELWRICSLVLWNNPDAFSVPISSYLHLRAPKESLLIPNLVAITDAGPIRVAVAIYEPGNEFGVPLCWSSVSIPWLADDGKKQFQALREYIGLILCHALIAKYYPKILFDRVDDASHSSYKLVKFQWVSDSSNALSWAAKGIARSLSCQVANMIVCWFALYSKIELVNQVHLAGSLMGDIDAESRKEKHLLMENLNYAPSLIPELKVNLESDEKFVSLLKLISPKNNGANVETFFKTFTDIHGILSHMFPSCS
jgi:hypothetical protein